MRRPALAILALIAALATRAGAEDEPPSPWGKSPPPRKLEPTPADGAVGAGDEEQPAAAYDVHERLKKFTHWLSVEEEKTPSPPVLSIQLGTVWFLTSTTRLRLGTGRDVPAIEDTLHAREGGPAPWGEFSIGDVVRAGAAVMDWERMSNGFRFIDTEVLTQDGQLAKPGDLVDTTVRYIHADAFVEWDPFYGHDYRIGLTGGMRYTRLSTRLRAIQLPQAVLEQSRADTEVFSPILGGIIELAPVPVVSFVGRFQVIDWSWNAVGLRNQRLFEARLGVSINFVPDLLGLAFDFRFLSALATTTASQGGRSRVDYDFDAAGIGLSFLGRF